MERISPQAWKSVSSSTQGRKPDLFPSRFSYPEMLLKQSLSDSSTRSFSPFLSLIPQLKAPFQVLKSY